MSRPYGPEGGKPGKEELDLAGLTPRQVEELHQKDDVDTRPESHHHTIGSGPNQAAPGSLVARVDALDGGGEGGEPTPDNLKERVEVLEAAYHFRQTVKFTAGGNFTKATYPWLKAIRVRVQGGGGGGGGSAATSASYQSFGQGGGGGGYAESFITDIAGLASSVTVTVGAGGTSSASNNGGAGGSSSFGTAVVATGGAGGALKPNAPYTAYVPGGIGGIGTAGDILTAGTGGASGAGDAYGLCASGAGGASALGGGGASNGTGAGSGSTVGNAGRAYGGGGGGATTNGGGAAQAGGVGGVGIVLIDLFS